MSIESRSMLDWPWLNVYRTLDWGWHAADPTVCIWIGVLPNGRYVPFDEEMWTYTPPDAVARDIHARSENMHVVTTFADPTMWDGEQEMGHCLADEFEQRRGLQPGIPLTKGKNDRTAAGYAIQRCLNEMLDDGLPRLQMWETKDGKGTPTLIRCLRSMRIDKKKPGRIADSKVDHLPIALGYFCQAAPGPTQVPRGNGLRKWMRLKGTNRQVIGAGLTRRRI